MILCSYLDNLQRRKRLKFFSVEKKLPPDSDWLLLKVGEYYPSGFTVGMFREGFKTEDGQDITEYVEKWADLPDYGLA